MKIRKTTFGQQQDGDKASLKHRAKNENLEELKSRRK